MTCSSRYRWAWGLVVWGTLSGCAGLPFLGDAATETPAPATATPETEASDTSDANATETPAAEPVSDSGATAQAEAAAPAAPQQDFFREGVNRAQSAVAIGQSAQSTDDWKLASSRWNQAVNLMQQVPAADPNYATAQQKVKEYQQNASLAERRAAGETPAAGTATNPRPDGLVAQIPIIERIGGTPIVPVTLTGNSGKQQFPMLFDTGATFTLITPAMAEQVGVLIVDEMVATVADGRQVRLPVGYLDALEVGGLVVRDVLVGIGGDAALLGQNVYGEYGISAGGSSINLYE